MNSKQRSHAEKGRPDKPNYLPIRAVFLLSGLDGDSFDTARFGGGRNGKAGKSPGGFDVSQEWVNKRLYLSIRYSEYIAEAGAERSVGSVGDSHDNRLSATIIWRYKSELIHRRGSWHRLDAAEYATLESVDSLNHRRFGDRR